MIIMRAEILISKVQNTKSIKIKRSLNGRLKGLQRWKRVPIFKLQAIVIVYSQMGLITVHLFQPNPPERIIQENPTEKQTAINNGVQTDLHHQFINILAATKQEQICRAVPIFKFKRSPLAKRIAPQSYLVIHCWQDLFSNRKLSHNILEYLNSEDLLMLKPCSKAFRVNAIITILRRDNNWDLTFGLLAPYLLQQTELRESGAQDDYEHSEDLDRTSGYFDSKNEQDLTEHQIKLDRIITTVSFKIQYFQGIMPICASLLQCFNENISYWLLRYLLYKCKYIQNDILFYNQYIDELDVEFKLLLPQVHKHLDRMGFELNYFVMKWIMGLFSEDMSKTMVLALWDLICQTDVYVVMYVIIEIFRQLKEEILIKETDEINELLKSGLKERLSAVKSQQLMRHTKELYITRRLTSL